MIRVRKIAAAFITMALCMPSLTMALSIPHGRALLGDLAITSGTTSDNATLSAIVALSNSGVASTSVSSTSGFAAGDYVLLMQMKGTGGGAYEILKIQSIVNKTLFFYSPLLNTYQSTGAQAIKISEYKNVTITGGTWTAGAWNGTTGGVLVALLTGTLAVSSSGAITAPTGFSGGNAATCTQAGTQRPCFQGDSATSTGGAATAANGMGGGGGQFDNGANVAAGGGGGGYGTGGNSGSTNAGGAPVGGTGGNTGGTPALQSGGLLMGGAGGGGDTNNGGTSAGSGGAGSGIIFIVSASSTFSGSAAITSNGSGGGAANNAGGGGGAGGGIRLPARINITIGSSLVTATGGALGSASPAAANGGAGGSGRIATLSSVTVNGTANPTIDTSSTDSVRNLDNDAITVSLASTI